MEILNTRRLITTLLRRVLIDFLKDLLTWQSVKSIPYVRQNPSGWVLLWRKTMSISIPTLNNETKCVCVCVCVFHIKQFSSSTYIAMRCPIIQFILGAICVLFPHQTIFQFSLYTNGVSYNSIQLGHYLPGDSMYLRWKAQSHTMAPATCQPQVWGSFLSNGLQIWMPMTLFSSCRVC
jgi:hypothetical protein